jgi:hypothetical protein
LEFVVFLLFFDGRINYLLGDLAMLLHQFSIHWFVLLFVLGLPSTDDDSKDQGRDESFRSEYRCDHRYGD